MRDLKVFSNKEFGDINVIVVNNKEYIEAIGLAKILGYVNPRDTIIRHCKKDGVIFSDVGVVTGFRNDGSEVIQYVRKKFIDEGNVYRLILRSKLPSAKKFEKWIMEEVIPSIRKHGAYMNEDVIEKALEDPDFIIQMVNKLKEEKNKRMLIEKKARKLEENIELNKPLVNFAKTIATSEDAITIGQFAKILNNNNIKIGRNRLFTMLRDNGYLIKNGKEKNMPKQVYIERGLFKVSESIVNTSEGEIISTTTLITGKGQKYFLEIINK